MREKPMAKYTKAYKFARACGDMNRKIILVFTILALFLLTFLVTSKSPEPNLSATSPCNWVKLNQEYELDLRRANYLQNLEISYREVNATFHVPAKFPYMEVRVTDGSILAVCTGVEDCKYIINDVNCGNIPLNNTATASTMEVYKLPQECVNAIHEGANKIGIYGGGGSNSTTSVDKYLLEKLYLEMKVRPANC